MRHQDLTMDWSTTKRMLTWLYIDESIFEVVMGGFRTFKIKIKQNPKNITIAISKSWKSNLIQRVFQVICTFYQIIPAGSVWQGFTRTSYPFALSSSGKSFLKQRFFYYKYGWKVSTALWRYWGLWKVTKNLIGSLEEFCSSYESFW